MRLATDFLGKLFENAPRFESRLMSEEAQESVEDLLDHAERIALDMPEDEQIELINGHPRIGADPASVSPTSFREQGYDRAPPSTDPELAERLARLNEAYESRFGFRFVVFVAGRPRAAIANFLESRLSAQREDELTRALSDVFAIARSRLQKLRQPLEEAR